MSGPFEKVASPLARSASVPRILEIGDHHHFKLQFPERTTLIWTGHRRPAWIDADQYRDFTPSVWWRAVRDLGRGEYDLVVTYPTLQPAWNPRYWAKSVAQTPLSPLSAFSRVFGVDALRATRFEVPLVAVDFSDAGVISRNSFFLLDKVDHYFKRELPVDHWLAVYGTAHPNLPTHRIRSDPKWVKRLAKLKPIGVGAQIVDFPGVDEFPQKEFDLFFSGAVEGNSTVRVANYPLLEVLRTRGVRIDIPEHRLPLKEFWQRMSRSWLAWSPSGRGWECHRHYEAAQAWSVPVINYPTVLRYQPLEDGVHAFLYAPEGDHLVRSVEAALADKDRLRRMAGAARRQALTHHTYRAMCEYVIKTAIGR